MRKKITKFLGKTLILCSLLIAVVAIAYSDELPPMYGNGDELPPMYGQVVDSYTNTL
jgi:hypothetical protein